MYVRGNVPGGSFGGLAGVWGFGVVDHMGFKVGPTYSADPEQAYKLESPMSSGARLKAKDYVRSRAREITQTGKSMPKWKNKMSSFWSKMFRTDRNAAKSVFQVPYMHLGESLTEMETRLAEREQAHLTSDANAALNDKDVLRKLAMLHSQFPQQRYHIEKVYELISSQKVFQ